MAVRIKEFNIIMNENGFPMLVQEMACNYDGTKKINSPGDVVNMMKTIFKADRMCEEYFFMLALNIKNEVKGIFRISHGNLDSTLVHPREVFVRAILCQTAAIILVHNHPSGNPDPSTEDIKVTGRLVAAGNILGITIHDHIIIAQDGYVSLGEQQHL